MEKKRLGAQGRPRRGSRDYSERKSVDTDPTAPQRADLERKFKQYSEGKTLIEISRLRQLLHCKRRQDRIDCNFDITVEQEQQLILKYQVSHQDAIDFETFYMLFLELTTQAEAAEQDPSKSEYGTLVSSPPSLCLRRPWR
jgi:hypothetical protein